MSDEQERLEVDTAEVSIDKGVETKEPKSMVMSFLGLAVALVAIFYCYPMIEKSLDSQTVPEKQVAEADDVVDVSIDEKVTAPVTQCSEELIPYLKMVKAQLLDRDGVTFHIVHLRMSKDQNRLLLDVKKTSNTGEERSDVILTRDDFGRYVSDDSKIKIYPPE